MLRKHVVVPLDFDLPRRPRRAPRRTPPVHAVCQRVLHLTLHLNHPVQEDVLELVGAHELWLCGKKKKTSGRGGSAAHRLSLAAAAKISACFKIGAFTLKVRAH